MRKIALALAEDVVYASICGMFDHTGIELIAEISLRGEIGFM